jgi:hypothetical protein
MSSYWPSGSPGFSRHAIWLRAVRVFAWLTRVRTPFAADLAATL